MRTAVEVGFISFFCMGNISLSVSAGELCLGMDSMVVLCDVSASVMIVIGQNSTSFRYFQCHKHSMIVNL